MPKPEIGTWVQGLPTGPGTYLFYGDYCSECGADGKRRPDRLQFMICTAALAGDGGVVVFAGGIFFIPVKPWVFMHRLHASRPL